MGNSNKKKLNQNIEHENEKIKNKYINYYCKKCKELPLLYFSCKYFDLFCSSHQILNIPIEDFYNYIAFDYECSICKVTSIDSKNYFYFNNDNKIYCKNCIISHKNEINNIQKLINAFQKNAVCLLHKKRYIKYCLKCKLNLCELCENHNNHYIEIFKEIYPLKEEIDKFNNNEKYKLNDFLFDEIEKFNEIKILLIQSFNENLSNYNYINNLSNLIKRTSINDDNYYSIKDIQNINNIDNKKDINSIRNKIPIKVKSHDFSFFYEVWCIKQLNIIKINPQQKLELIAIGVNSTIILLNIITFGIYQTIKEHNNKLYSFDQFKDNPNYLFSSSKDESINIYKLNSKYKYKLIQKIKKSKDKSGGEISKVIALSNKLLVSGDHRSITIWKSNNKKNKKELNYEDFYEIIINYDTCNLLEVNPSIFVATQCENGGHFQVYKNEGESFPLIGDLNLKSHGYSTNGLCKINDKLICSVDRKFLFIICIAPLQVIQKIFTKNYSIYNISAAHEDYLYYTDTNCIAQYKIIKDEDNNFIELVEIDKYQKYIKEAPILPFDDGRIFFIDEREYKLLA